jgi:biotin transport system substrate-specific component
MKSAFNIFSFPLKNEKAKDLTFAFFASIILALFAPLTFLLPFTPVPVTFQVQAALLLSLILGARRASLMMLFFLGEGILGLPVFAGGAATIFNLMGPRGGYLFGYLVVACVISRIYSAFPKKHFGVSFITLLIGNLIVYAFGFTWMSQFFGFRKAFALGVTPFILVDLFKLTIAATMYELFRKCINCFGKSSC